MANEEVEILDTYFESFKHYKTAEYEQEFFNLFASSLTLRPRLIHVHSNIDFSRAPENTLFIFGKRNLFSWRQSWIWHNLKDSYVTSNRKNKDSMGRKFFLITMPSKIRYLHVILTEDVKRFYSNQVILNSRRNKHFHVMNDKSIIESIQVAQYYLLGEVLPVQLKKYQNNSLKKSESHNIDDFLSKTFSFLLASSTLPYFLLNTQCRRLKQRFSQIKWNQSQNLSTVVALSEDEKSLQSVDQEILKNLRGQNLLKNSTFEICSELSLLIQEDGTFCSNNWYVNRGGEVQFRLFSRSHQVSCEGEAEAFIEIENRSSGNAFIELVQELDLGDLQLDIAGKFTEFSFEIRRLSTLSSSSRIYALIYYRDDSGGNMRLINTVKEVKFDTIDNQKNWNQFSVLSQVPENSREVLVAIALLGSEWLDVGDGLQIKNPHFRVSSFISTDSTRS